MFVPGGDILRLILWFVPGLERMVIWHPFFRGDFFTDDFSDIYNTGSSGLAIDEYLAGTAHFNTAAEFGAAETSFFIDYPD